MIFNTICPVRCSWISTFRTVTERRVLFHPEARNSLWVTRSRRCAILKVWSEKKNDNNTASNRWPDSAWVATKHIIANFVCSCPRLWRERLGYAADLDCWECRLMVVIWFGDCSRPGTMCSSCYERFRTAGELSFSLLSARILYPCSCTAFIWTHCDRHRGCLVFCCWHTYKSRA